MSLKLCALTLIALLGSASAAAAGPQQFPSAKARKVRAALIRIGWTEARSHGSHKTFTREGWPSFVFTTHHGVDIDPVSLSHIAKQTGLRPEDL